MSSAIWLYLYWSLQVKLVQHTYSCLFGTFLCNNAKERGEKHTQERTCSVWSLLRAANKAFKNLLYSSQSESVRILSYPPHGRVSVSQGTLKSDTLRSASLVQYPACSSGTSYRFTHRDSSVEIIHPSGNTLALLFDIYSWVLCSVLCFRSCIRAVGIWGMSGATSEIFLCWKHIFCN